MEKERKEKPQMDDKEIRAKCAHNRAIIEMAIKKHSDDLYHVFFDRSNPDYVNAWNEVHDIYLLILHEEYPLFCDFVTDLEHALNFDLRLRAVYLLFKKIVPTIDPTDFEPLALLFLAIINVIKREDFNLLCIFIQIASTRLKEIEDNYLSDARSREGRIANSATIASTDPFTQKEAAMLNHLFTEIEKKKMEFTDGYRKIMVNELIKNKKYLIKKTAKYNKNNEKKAVLEINKLYSQIDEIKKDDKDAEKNKEEKRLKIAENLLTIKRLEKHYYDRYLRWKGRDDNTIMVRLESIKKAIYYPLLQNVFWKTLEPWPIKEHLDECSECVKPLFDIPLIAILSIIILCAKGPRSLDEINKMMIELFNLVVKKDQLDPFVQIGYLELAKSDNPADSQPKYRLGNTGYDFLKDKKI